MEDRERDEWMVQMKKKWKNGNKNKKAEWERKKRKGNI